ncbi:MAG: hypothetical protein AAF800_01395 [Planctomycetota bacterium]
MVPLVRPVPKKNPRGSGMDDLAGGAAYARFVQTVLWYQQHADDKQSTVLDKTAFGDVPPEVLPHTRSLALRKTRNGQGGESKLAFDFDPQTLRSKELGVVVKGKLGADGGGEVLAVGVKEGSAGVGRD